MAETPKLYFLLGVYPPEECGSAAYQRWADWIGAPSPEAAERIALKLHPGLVIAGVLEDPEQKLTCQDGAVSSPIP